MFIEPTKCSQQTLRHAELTDVLSEIADLYFSCVVKVRPCCLCIRLFELPFLICLCEANLQLSRIVNVIFGCGLACRVETIFGDLGALLRTLAAPVLDQVSFWVVSGDL